MRLAALWWWIDRWRKSSAYMDMTLEEQGAYRNLLDEAHLRGGPLPDDDRILAKACGDALAWPRVKKTVLARFVLLSDGWHNDTLDEILGESVRRATNQANYRARTSQKSDNGRDNATDNDADNNRHNKPASPSPSPSPDLITVSRSKSKPSSESKSDSDFEAFRSAYPKNRRQGGKRTKAAFREARKTTSLEAMLAALEQHKRSEQWQEPKLIPLMTTWLHQERWTQELPSAQTHQRAVDYCGRPTFTSQNPAPWKCQLHDPPCATTDVHCALMAQKHGGSWRFNSSKQLCEKHQH